jgi:lysophospholipase L1-like esterase
MHAAGVEVFGGTLTSALGVYGTTFPTADNGPVAEAGRQVLNAYIRQPGSFDGVEDFDGATLDPGTGNMAAAYLPNSQFTQLPWDYLHPNHAGYNAMGMVVDIAPFAPHRGD